MKKFFGVIALAAILFGQVSPAFADDGEMMAMLESMKQQMTKMQNTIDSQSDRIQELESRRTREVSTPSSAATSSSPTMSDADFQKSLKDNVGQALPWLKGLKQSGDFRLRYEGFNYYDHDMDNTTATPDRARNRFRVRLRWGLEKEIGDDWKVGFRLATSPDAAAAGQPTDNTSTNQTLGDYFNFKSFNVDKAYAQYTPNGLKDYGMIKGVTIGAGKFDNPFLRYSTPITWDGDVTPEGAYEKVALGLISAEENKLNFYGTAGQFVINEGTAMDRDTFMMGYQGAFNWNTYSFGTERPVDASIALSYYDYIDYASTVQPAANNTAATSYLRTNTFALTEPAILDFYPEVIVYAWDQPLTLWYNYVKNVGAFNNDIINTNPAHSDDTAWGLGFKYGKLKTKGTWELFYGYYEIGSNAVVAAFSDSDFGGPGGNGYTNRIGQKFGVGYQLTDAISVNWTGYVVAPLAPVAATIAGVASADEKVFRSQLDAVYKF